MKRSLLICLSVLLALAAIAATALAMESRSVQGPNPASTAANGTARVAVAHLAPFGTTTAVTVELDGTAVLTDFEYGESTAYLPVPTGTHSVAIYPAGSTTPAISETVDLEAKDYTAIAVGDGANQSLGLKLLEDDNTPPAAGKFRVRVGHLAPFASAITDTLADVRLQDGTLLLDDVPYGAVATLPELDAGTYDLKITSPDGSVTLIDPMPATFNAGDIVSVFATGDGANQPLGAFALPSNAQGFFLDLAVSLQVAHLAPFAMDPGTAVTVTIDSTAVLTDFAFGDSTGYLPLQAGVDHLIEIFPAGSGTAAISATVNLTHPLDFTAIAVGGANGWPLGLELLQDDNTPPPINTAKVRVGHLAPFAPTITGTLADVRLQDGTPVPGATGVPYGAIAPYTALPAGSYDLKITAPGGTPTLIDPFLVTFNSGDILSVFAVGDGTNQPLGVFALPSGQPGALLPLAKYQWLPIIVKNAAP